VSFDAEHRRELLDSFRAWWREVSGASSRELSWRERVRELVWGPAAFSSTQRWIYRAVVLLLAALIVLLARAGWIIAAMLRERLAERRRRRAAASRPAAARFYDQLLLLLARQGLVRPRSLTPREFARDVSARRPDLAPIQELTEWYYELQFGGQTPSRARREMIDGLLERLRNQGRLDAAEGA
jgi:hypothetical protein